MPTNSAARCGSTVIGYWRANGWKAFAAFSRRRPQEAEDRQLTALRKRLGQLRTRTINKIKHVLRKHNLEQEQPAKGLDTKRTRKWLATLPLGTIDRLEMNLLLEQWKLWDDQLAKLELEIRKASSRERDGRRVGDDSRLRGLR